MTELLSVDHCILEKGSMEHRPFGVGPTGEKIRDVSGVVIRANLEYLEELIARFHGTEAGGRAVEDLCRLLNERIQNPAYHVSPAFLKNVWHSYSYEFAVFLGEFCFILSGDPNFQFAMASEKFLPPVIQALGRPFSVAQIYGMFPHFGQKFAKGSLEFDAVKVEEGVAVLRMRLTEHVARQFGPYRKACARLICQASKAGLAAVPKQIHGLQAATIVDRSCLADGADYCEWEFRWEGTHDRAWLLKTIFGAAGLATGSLVFGFLRLRHPSVSLPEAIGLALLPIGAVWMAAVGWTARLSARRRDRLLSEQLRAQELKHEELREAYLEQEQATVELKRIAMENAGLYEELGLAFEGFVRASITAIESRDPATSGHSTRVAALSCGLAEAVDRLDSGRYASVSFSADEIKELRYAALLHDFGKVGVREHILLKAEKLLPDQHAVICARFQMIKQSLEIRALRRKVALLSGTNLSRDKILMKVDRELQHDLAETDEILTFLLECNRPTVLADGNFSRLANIAARTYDLGDGPRPYLTPDEVECLSIRRGSLTSADRRQMENHVKATYEFLCAIPWSRSLSNVPAIAYGHHEKLDGGGYPRGVSGRDISLPTRMMTISDIYDALTAGDRPYKPSVSSSDALDILSSEARIGKLDADLLRVFVEAKVYARNGHS